MRSLILISVAVLVAACSDDRQPTSPRSFGGTGSATTVSRESRNVVAGAQAKPVDQVGFTKTTVVASPELTISNLLPQDMTKSIAAACPIGSAVVGGGYRILIGAVTINASEPVKSPGVGYPDTWNLTATLDPNLPSATVKAWVVCAS